MIRTLAAAFLVVLGATFARADQDGNPTASIVEQAVQTARLAGSAGVGPDRAKTAGDALQRSLENARVTPVVGYKWAVEKDLKDTPSDASRLINAAEKRLKPDGISVPGPTASEALAELKKMHSDGRVSMGELPATTNGVYNFDCHKDPIGSITLSERLSYLGMLIGDALAASVGFHEIGHRLDDKMHGGNCGSHAKEDMARVEEEEAKAFALQQQYLRNIYKNDSQGHEIFATTLMRLEWEQRVAPNPLRKAAIAFVKQANRVYSAVDEMGRPDMEKLKKMVREWYKADGSPAAA